MIGRTRPCCLSGRFEWGDGGIAGEAAVRDLNVPVRQWIVPRQGLDRGNCITIARLARVSKGNSIGLLSSSPPSTQKVTPATADTYAPNCGLPRPGTDSPVRGSCLGRIHVPQETLRAILGLTGVCECTSLLLQIAG